MTSKLPFLLVLIPVFLLGCSESAPPVRKAPATVRARVVKSADPQIAQPIAATGTVHAKETATISAQMPGNIRQVWVQAGDRVRTGQLLVTLDDAAARSALARATAAQVAAEKQQLAARSSVALAAGTLARYQILREQNSVSPQEFDEVQQRSTASALQLQSLAAQREEARAAVAGARAQLGYTQLRAPFSGVVTARMADPGTLATPGTPLLTLDRDGPLQLYTSVDESLIDKVRLGMKIPVSVDGVDSGEITGIVAQIVPAADPASRTFQVKLDLPALRQLRPGMFGTADFPGATRSMIVVPQSAVVVRGSLACVYAINSNGIAQLRYVTLGNRQGDRVEILSGLGPDETLVDNPGDQDLAGKRIEAQP